MASAGLALLAFVPYLGLLALVALAPWIASLRRASPREGWRSGYGFGVIYGAGQLFWIAQFVARWTDSWLIGLIPFAITVLLFALYFGLAGVAVAKCWAAERVWLIPIAWAGVEVFRSFIPVFAFPWGLIATPLWPITPLIQSAWFGTIYLVGTMCVAFSAAIAVWLTDGPRRLAIPAWALGLTILVLAATRYAMPEGGHRRVVTVIQPGVDMAFGDPATEEARLHEHLTALLDRSAGFGSSLIVMPEGIVDGLRADGIPHAPFDRPDVPVLVGGQRRGDDATFQSAFMLRREGTESVDKTRLVIFGEYVPLRSILPAALKLPSGDLAPGRNGVQTLNQGEYRVGPMLCFEGLFADIAYRQALHRPDFLAVLSIDDWYMDTSAIDQLYAASVWRAVETGLPLVRSASLGRSLAVDARGRVIARLPLHDSGAFRVELYSPDGYQPPVWLPVFPLVSLGGLIAALVMRPRSKPA